MCLTTRKLREFAGETTLRNRAQRFLGGSDCTIMIKLSDEASASRAVATPNDQASKLTGIIADLETILEALASMGLTMTVALLDQAFAEAKHDLTILS